jgi:hypothetical protein
MRYSQTGKDTQNKDVAEFVLVQADLREDWTGREMKASRQNV